MIEQARQLLRRQVIAFRRRRTLAQGDAPPEWYDKAYSEVEGYQSHWSESAYLPVWEAITSRIPAGSRVLEIGCGPAQLARMMLDRGILESYVGFDFSPTAIALARSNVGGHRVQVADAHTTDLFETADYDVAVCTEVLEHISDDVGVLKRIASGTQLLATVPDFDWDSHVRFFRNKHQVIARYGPLFDALEVTEHFHAGDPSGHNGVFFLMNGTLK